MTNKELLRRWEVLRKQLVSMGIDPELDLLNVHLMVVRVRTNQNLSDLIVWSYDRWDDVKSCWQSRDDGNRTFGVSFRKPKDWTPDEEEGD